MPGMKVFLSNRLETLASELARVLRTPRASPLEPEIVVVQSTGMQRWISMKLASLNGICANMKFPFPNALLSELFERVMPGVNQDESFDVEHMTWKLMALIPEHLGDPGFSGLRAYLEDDGDARKRYQFSRILADTFDQYLIFRPEMIRVWDRGNRSGIPGHAQDEYWQACLWQALVKTKSGLHRTELWREFPGALESCDPNRLPKRISIFGISYLPRFHLDVISAISSRTDVFLFLMNPCREFWFDIRSSSEISRIKRYSGDKSRDELHLEQGNPILASLGGLGRTFFSLVHEHEFEGYENYSPSDRNTMLGYIQNDILELRCPTGNHEITQEDRSIQVHSCHSPMREVEVLFESLLGMFEEIPGLRPEDILVMAPDIEVYAPLVHAVFTSSSHDPRYIPHGIADRSLRALNDITDTFLALLDIPQSRLEATKVYALLECDALRRKFSLEEKHLSLIQDWISVTNIRCGRDAVGEKEGESDGIEQNTWEWGIRKLLLGYALPAQSPELFCDILPYDDMEGEDALVLGRFLDFVRAVFSWMEDSTRARSLLEWSETLKTFLEAFFLEDEESQAYLHAIRTVLSEFARSHEIAGFHDQVSLVVIKAALQDRLSRSREGQGFISGGVTFCSMLPMRSIPFRVIWLMGMNHANYPRQSVRTGFDLISAQPGSGDRSKRDDDLAIFLEAMLSAHDAFCMSYIGQGIQDNASIPPSVVVSTLMDYVDDACCFSDNRAVVEHMLRRHPLQAFNPKYFTGTQGLFSYSSENERAAKRLVCREKVSWDFGEHPLKEPGLEWKILDGDGLCRFFRNPAEFLLTRRLGIFVRDRTKAILDREPFDLDPLHAYQYRQMIIRDDLAGIDPRKTWKQILAQGTLPHGIAGQDILEELTRDVKSQITTIRDLSRNRTPEQVRFDLVSGDFLIHGSAVLAGEHAMISYRGGLLRGNDLVRTWIMHLFLCAAHDPRVMSHHVARDRLITFEPVKYAPDILAELLTIYWSGLSRPIHFFPQSSWKFVLEKKSPAHSRQDCLNAARDAWNGGYAHGAEKENSYYRICFSTVDPLDDEFVSLSENVFMPLMAHARQEKL
ncbi:MAG TPA: exodeoxyribonuclease V subunit gamma [Deltaproteobacteria bacterium]|nr:exodeoxyribonuclease V subunit gamma [Deltaproteobacteria bacterium]